MKSIAHLTMLLLLPVALLVMPVHGATIQDVVLDWDVVSWPTPPPMDLDVTFYNVDNSGMDIRISITDGGLIDSSNPRAPDDLNFLTGGYTAAQGQYNLFVRQITTTPTSSTIVKVEFLGGTASNIELKAFDVDSQDRDVRPRPRESFRDWVKVTGTNDSGAIDPSSIQTSAANQIPNANRVSWFNSNFPGADVSRSNTVRGIDDAASNSSDGNATYTFSQEGITELEIEYWNSWDLERNRRTNGNQWIGLLHQLTFDAVVVPEPSMFCMLAAAGACAIGIGLYRRRRYAGRHP